MVPFINHLTSLMRAYHFNFRIIFCFTFVQLLCCCVSMKLDTPEFHAIITPELKTLAKIFEKYGFQDEIRIVGGAVRDLLSGKKPADLDFATTATPQEMKDMFNKEHVRMFNTNGEKHGTISVRINDKENFEITTLRDDVITDGRHAIVQFTRDWFVDATRRDLTINAMYLEENKTKVFTSDDNYLVRISVFTFQYLEGNLYDYYHGYEDLKDNRLRFVGEADKRIREDYLRILRYFRFFGRIAKSPRDHDSKTLDAIRINAAGLERISGERIWSELHRILTGNFVSEIVEVMLELGLARYIGLSHPTDLDIASFDTICNNRKKYLMKPITIMASLLKTNDEVLTLHNRLKLSSFERDLACFIVEHKNDTLPSSDNECFNYFQRLLIFTKMNRDVQRAFIVEFLKYVDREAVIVLLTEWIIPEFPIDGTVLMREGIKGKQIGLAMKELKEKWIENNFSLHDDIIVDVVSHFKNLK